MTGLRLSVGVDVGGTKIAAAVVDSRGTIRHKIKLRTDCEDPGRSVVQVAQAAHAAVSGAGVGWERISAVGVDVPGICHPRTGRVWCPNLPGWDQIPLCEMLRPRLPRPVVADSDRAAYVLGEQWMGAARGLDDVIFLAVGTGIGAGILTAGRVYRGADGVAGAVGWFVLGDSRKARYAEIGCFEAEAAGPAVGRRGAELAAKAHSRMLQLAGGRLEEITAEVVAEAARQGDGPARQVIEETGRYLGKGIANLVSALNPQMVVLGGGLMGGGELLLAPLLEEMRSWAQPVSGAAVRVELTRLGEDAGVLGAARMALEADLAG